MDSSQVQKFGLESSY